MYSHHESLHTKPCCCERHPTPGNFLHPHQVSHALGGLWPADSPCGKDNASPQGTFNRPHSKPSQNLEPLVYPAKPKGIVASDWLQAVSLDSVWLSAGEILRSVSAARDGVRKSERGLSEVQKGRPPRCATAGVDARKAISKRGLKEEKRSLVSMSTVWDEGANCWIPPSDRDGFACLRCLQQNMINGTCGFNTWCVFTQQIGWRRVKSVTDETLTHWRDLKKLFCSIYAACNDNYFYPPTFHRIACANYNTFVSHSVFPELFFARS